MSHQKLYNKLDVSVKASSSDIKKAYRKKAKAAHPDHGGSEEEFNSLNRAYSILVNPDSRKKYDATGDEALQQPDNEQSKIMGIIAGALENTIAKFETKGKDPLESDLVSEMKILIKDSISNYEKQIAACNILISKTKRLVGKFKVKNGNNFIEQMLLAKIDNIGLNIKNSEREMEPLKKAYDILGDVSFSFAPRETVQMSQHVNMGSIFGTGF